MSILEFRVATEFDVVKIKLSTEAKTRIAKCETKNDEQPNGLCMGCLEPLFDPQIEAPRRGCHKACCKAFYNAIASGRVDEDGDLVTNKSLLEKGKWKLPESGGRKPKNKAVVGFKSKQRRAS